MESTTRSPPPAALERIGRYRIVRPLSKGGMALVYEARRESLAGVSPRVAIKLILPEYTASGTFQELFINEARLGASMHHQNLVQIQDFDADGDRFFLVMEYVEGITLRRAISLSRRNDIHVPMGVIAEIGRQACDGLDYAHLATDEAGQHLALVHRDVKPSNLILNPQGVVKLVDFGISKGRRLVEKKGTVKGTWGYMSPEQARGAEVAPVTDIFGLAAVLFELAAKRPLFPDKTPDTVKRLLNDDHAARMAATLDPAYRLLVSPLIRALQRDPAARFASAREFGRALSSLLPDPISARDEVVRFYEGIFALHEGLPAPAGTISTDASVPSPFPGAPRPPGAPRLPGAPRPPGTMAPGGILIGESPMLDEDSASSMGKGSSEPDAGSMFWLVASVIGVVLLLFLVVGGGVLWALSTPTVAVPIVPISAPVAAPQPVSPASPPGPPVSEPAQDEPAGPAGVGAPGEQVPPPVARRTAAGPDPAPAVSPAPRGERPPPTSTVASPAVSASPGRGDGVSAPAVDDGVPAAEHRVVVVRRAPVPQPAAVPDPAAGAPAASAGAPAPDTTGPGFLTVGSRQAAEVYIDGRFVRRVPLVRRELEIGPHVITIQAGDGRKKTFDIDVTAGEELRRVWDFDRAEWRP